MRCSFGYCYLLIYNLWQFCGHTWIFANMSARFLSFGEDAVADTFYFAGVVMSSCQLLMVLEVFHIADGLEEASLLARFIQVTQRNFLLFVVISTQEQLQSKPIVCVLFYVWSIADLLRYPHTLMDLMATPPFPVLWVRYTLWLALYPLTVLTEGVTVLLAVSHVGSLLGHSVLLAYLPVLGTGACVCVWTLLTERKRRMDNWSRNIKRK